MESEKIEIQNTAMIDLNQIIDFFECSIQYQERKGYPVWKNYDKRILIKDIEERNQYKIMVNSITAIVFSVRYEDSIIWRTREKGDSIYLHRIVINPVFKGKRLFGTILQWAVQQAKKKNLSSIRMDTWADNSTIISYYKSFGFLPVENYTTPDTEELPLHNRKLALTLLEYRIDH